MAFRAKAFRKRKWRFLSSAVEDDSSRMTGAMNIVLKELRTADARGENRLKNSKETKVLVAKKGKGNDKVVQKTLVEGSYKQTKEVREPETESKPRKRKAASDSEEEEDTEPKNVAMISEKLKSMEEMLHAMKEEKSQHHNKPNEPQRQNNRLCKFQQNCTRQNCTFLHTQNQQNPNFQPNQQPDGAGQLY